MNWVGIAIVCAGVNVVTVGPAAADPLRVEPGTVVRWPGDGTVTGCLIGGEVQAPIEGDCYFAVDLLTPPGGLEIGRRHGGEVELRMLEVVPYPYPEQHLRVDPAHVDLSPAAAARAAEETARIGELWRQPGPRRYRLPLAAPLTDMPAGGRFGSRRVFNGEPRSPHSGVDLAAPAGTPVLAVADGTVKLAEEQFFGGNSVFLDHGDELVSMYFHLSRIDVSPGKQVHRGQQLGTVGATGRATGPHLHLGLRWHGARIDPRPLLGPVDELPTVAADGRAGAPR